MSNATIAAHMELRRWWERWLDTLRDDPTSLVAQDWECAERYARNWST